MINQMRNSLFFGLLCFVFVSLLSFPPLCTAQVDDFPPTILVDSSETLANEGGEHSYVSYGEWNSAGDYEGWTVNNKAFSSVSGGVLTATENVGDKGVVWNFTTAECS